MKIRIGGNESIFVAILCVLFMQPYFTWDSYQYNTVFVILQYLILAASLVFLGIRTPSFFSTDNGRGRDIILIMLLTSFYYFTGEQNMVGSWGVLLQYFFIIKFYVSCSYKNEKTIDFLKKIFAILLLPSIVFFILRLCGIIIPFDILADYREDSTRIYLHNFLTVLTATKYSASMPMMRLCGILDEPGATGTYAALMLMCTDYKLKSKYDKILFIAGILSLSTAFVVLTVMYIFITRFSLQKEYRIRARLLILMLIAGIAFIFIPRIGFINAVFGKLSKTDIRGTYRIWEMTKSEFGSNIFKHLFGNGYLSGMFGGDASWTTLIHDIGIIGVAITIIYILLVGSNGVKNKHCMAFRLCFIASMCQRPTIMNIPYMVIFMCGISNLYRYSDPTGH